MLPGIPGFAAGGYVPNYAGAENWMAGSEYRFGRSVENSYAVRLIAQLKAAVKKAAAAAAGNINYRPGAGVAQWRGVVDQALRMEGLSLGLDSRVLAQMQSESGGNPNAINNWDINAQRGDPSRGLMQVIMSTFRAYHWPGTSSNIYNPLANIAAAINYARHVYGPGLQANGFGIGSLKGYDKGGWLMPGATLAVNNTGRPEQVIPAGGPAGRGAAVILEVAGTGSGTFDAFLLKWIRENVRVKGGGSVQTAFGR
jgi:SLT domain-containing protein